MKDITLVYRNEKISQVRIYIVYFLLRPPSAQNRCYVANQTLFTLQLILRYWPPHRVYRYSEVLRSIKVLKVLRASGVDISPLPCPACFINTSLSNKIKVTHLPGIPRDFVWLRLSQQDKLCTCIPVHLCTVHLTRGPVKVWLNFYNNANLCLTWVVFHDHTTLTCTVKF